MSIYGTFADIPALCSIEEQGTFQVRQLHFWKSNMSRKLTGRWEGLYILIESGWMIGVIYGGVCMCNSRIPSISCDSGRILNLIPLENLSWIIISIISEWYWKTNTASLSRNSDSIRSIRRESENFYSTSTSSGLFYQCRLCFGMGDLLHNL